MVRLPAESARGDVRLELRSFVAWRRAAGSGRWWVPSAGVEVAEQTEAGRRDSRRDGQGDLDLTIVRLPAETARGDIRLELRAAESKRWWTPSAGREAAERTETGSGDERRGGRRAAEERAAGSERWWIPSAG